MLRGDSNPWRIFPHAAMYDPLAVLEDTKGSAFKAQIALFESQWARELAKCKNKAEWIRGIRDLPDQALPLDVHAAHEVFQWNTTEVAVQWGKGHQLHIWFDGVLKHKGMTDFGVDLESDMYYTIEDVGQGAELLQLSLHKRAHSKNVWTTKPVGPTAAFLNDAIVYTTAENHLRYSGVESRNKYTGHSVLKLHHQPSHRIQVNIMKPPRQPDVFVVESDGLKQRCGVIHSRNKIHWMTGVKETTIVPVTQRVYAVNDALVINRIRRPFPPQEFLVDALPWSAQEYLVTTTKDACVSLYIYSTEIHRYIPIFKSRHPNNIQLMRRVPSALLEWPHKPSEIWDLRDERKLYAFPGPIQIHHKSHGHAVSKDGTRVPYTFVSYVSSPERLIVEAYGAYGISGHRNYPLHWLAWLQKGYGLAVAFPRGGRENGDAWYKGGSTAQNKHNTFEDVYAVIQHVQRAQKIGAESTLFYGRSAGGWVAARVAQHLPPIVGAVYAEVPYVDVLRTTSNPRLPLTELEYTEFGDPVHKEADYEALQRISPMETIPMAPRNAPFVLVRTAFYDVQVLPYESVKYVTKLQASGFHALLGYDKHGGHFAEEDDAVKQQAEDAVLLHYALSSKGPKHTRKRRSSNRRTRRRANS